MFPTMPNAPIAPEQERLVSSADSRRSVDLAKGMYNNSRSHFLPTFLIRIMNIQYIV